MSKQTGTKIFVAITLLCMLLCTNIVNATTYLVGDPTTGWDYDTGSSWPTGKTFKAGDVLVFYYSKVAHNVVVVDKNGYDKCDSTGGKTYTSGNDHITLVKGPNYFICDFPGQCESGMKMIVTAA